MNSLDTTRDIILERLKNGIVWIRFNKVDGSERSMYATLQPEYIPESSTGSRFKKTPNPNLLVVVDVEIEEWRSIRMESILNFNLYPKILPAKIVLQRLINKQEFNS